MKKTISLILSLIMMLTMFAGVDFSAMATISEDFEYQLLDDGTAEIVDYTGSATELTIPSTIDGYTVTSIGYQAFYFCEDLRIITIPKSVSNIGHNAFYSCENLEVITMYDNVISIGSDAFYNTAYYNNDSNCRSCENTNDCVLTTTAIF